MKPVIIRLRISPRFHGLVGYLYTTLDWSPHGSPHRTDERMPRLRWLWPNQHSDGSNGWRHDVSAYWPPPWLREIESTLREGTGYLTGILKMSGADLRDRAGYGACIHVASLQLMNPCRKVRTVRKGSESRPWHGNSSRHG